MAEAKGLFCILYLDDDPNNALIVRAMLENAGERLKLMLPSAPAG